MCGTPRIFHIFGNNSNISLQYNSLSTFCGRQISGFTLHLNSLNQKISSKFAKETNQTNGWFESQFILGFLMLQIKIYGKKLSAWTKNILYLLKELIYKEIFQSNKILYSLFKTTENKWKLTRTTRWKKFLIHALLNTWFYKKRHD